MKKIFVVGVGPLPFYKSRIPQNSISEGTWQVIQPLLEDGHKVRAITLEFGQQGIPEIEYLQQPREISPNFEHQYYEEPFRTNCVKIARQIQMALSAFDPDCVISAGSMIAAWVSTLLKHRLPTWYDIKGGFMPELQLLMEKPDPQAIFEVFPVYKSMLIRGDRFSAVTQRQADMVLGELGMVGRLNAHTLGENLVTVKPTGLPPNSPKRLENSGRIRGKLCEENDLVLFSSGGFNTWQDTRMFFEVVEGTLQAELKSCFVCLGGGIGGHHNEGFTNFEKWVSESPVKNRIHLVGWVPQAEVVEYESEADIGINCDLDIPESWFGDRSRFLSWMARRVVVATTPVCQPSEQLVKEGKAIGLPLGDATEAVRILLETASNKERLLSIASAAEDHARTQWSYRETTTSLREWVSNPVLAGDNRIRFEQDHIDFQQELGSLELALDRMFTWDERNDKTRDWKRIQKILLQRWPWPDGRKL